MFLSSKVFRSRTPQNALDLISHILKYNPGTRFNAQQAMAHEFFEELRMPNAKLPSNAQLPPLFDFRFILNRMPRLTGFIIYKKLSIPIIRIIKVRELIGIGI
jgi:serine/threonine protein kinase